MLEETLESPWTARRSNLSILKEVNPECSLEAEAPVLWPSHEKTRLPGKDPDVGKMWRQEEKGMSEDEMVGQCHSSYQHEFDPTPGASGREEDLACSGPWGHEELDMTK